MKTLDDIIQSCTDPATESELQALKENLEQIYSKVENAEDCMSMFADADIYENYLSASNRLYELLYGEIIL